MQYIKPLPLTGLLLALFLSGCATTSGDRETMPDWVGDKVERDIPDADNSDAESPIDASNLFGFLSNKYKDKKDDGPILAIDPNKKPDITPSAEDVTQTKEPKQKETRPDTTTADAKKTESVVTIPTPKPMIARNSEHKAQASSARSGYQVALAEMKAGNLVGALEIFTTLSKQYPLLSGPVVNQGIILRKQGKLKEARKVLQDALYSKFQNPYLLNELGAVNRELGHFKQAKQSYLSAIRIENAYGNAHYNLAVLADLYLHDPELALTEFEIYQSLQKKPRKKVNGWIKELKRRIKRINKAKT